MMDVATNTVPDFYCVSHSGRSKINNSLRIRKRSLRLSQQSTSSNETLNNNYKIKYCSVILERIDDEKLRKYLNADIKSETIKSAIDNNTKSFKMIPEEPIKMEDDTKSGLPDSPVGVTMLATDHLDLLLIEKEMKLSYLQIQRRYINSMGPINLDPVVILERLPSQLISDYVNGSANTQKIQQEAALTKSEMIPVRRRKAFTGERRRSQRSSVVKSYCSCCSGSSSVSIGDEENIPSTKSRRTRRKTYSSDDEEFYGFEVSEREKHRTLKLRRTLTKMSLQPSRKENGKHIYRNPDKKINGRQKVPLKAVNRIESANRVPENISIFKHHRILDDLQIRFFDLNGNGRKDEKEVYTKNKYNNKESVIGTIPAHKMEIIKLIQKREETKMLMDRLLIGQRKSLRSRKLGNNFSIGDIDYLSNAFYIIRGCGKVPVWSDAKCKEIIMKRQDEIPLEMVTDYFHTQETSTLVNPFSSSFES